MDVLPNCETEKVEQFARFGRIHFGQIVVEKAREGLFQHSIRKQPLRRLAMKRFHLVVLTLALSSALIYGCAEKKEATEKPKEAASAPVEAVAQKPVEPEAPVARVDIEIKPEKAAVVKEQAKAPVKKAAEVEAVKAVEKAVVEKEAAAVAAVKTAEKAVEEKAVAAGKAVETALTPAPAAGDAATGALLFKAKCAPCHGAEGKGTTMAPALKGNDWVKAASSADITGVIKNGRLGKAKKYPNFFVDMPASKAMAENDLNALAAYLKSLN